MLFHRHHYCGRLQCPTVTDIVDSSVSIRLPCFGLLAAATVVQDEFGFSQSRNLRKKRSNRSYGSNTSAKARPVTKYFVTSEPSCALYNYPRPKVGFSFRNTGSQIRYHVCDAENQTARTKTALNLLGLAPWKNTHLLGTSNLISFLLASPDGVQSGWVNGAGDYDT